LLVPFSTPNRGFIKNYLVFIYLFNYIDIMYTTYTLNTDELTSQFISALQQIYPGKKVEIVVQEAQDETDYLLKDSQLLTAVEDINNGRNLVSVPLESF